jgi:hypothetical protein
MLYCFFAMYLMKLERMINGFLSGKVQGCNLGPAGFRCPKTLGVCYRGGVMMKETGLPGGVSSSCLRKAARTVSHFL